MNIIVDYGMGNLRSVEKAVEFIGKKVIVTDSKYLIKKAKKIIFPGVGHFGKAVKELKKRGIFEILKGIIKEGVPFLGICLGMQLLFKESQEAKGVKGLGVLEGRVEKFIAKNLIVPHMGWNRIKLKNTGLFSGIENGSYLYFAHSYYCKPKERSVILTTTDYGGYEFVSSLHKNNIWAVQFHPEKSQRLGLAILSNFFNLC